MPGPGSGAAFVIHFVRVVALLSRLAAFLSAGLLAAAVVVVCHMVFVRYILGASTVWQTEFVVYALVAATFLGSPYVLLRRGHVGVDLLPELLGGPGRRILAILAGLFSLAFAAVIAYAGWIYFHEAWANGWRTQTVWAPPLWIPLLPLPVGMGLLALACIGQIWQEATGRRSAEGP
jgi:TRAP-type C4-dicarboxylate transport system permease small subunit